MTAPHGEAQKDPAGGAVLDVVVVGGSQAGLAMAWYLAQQGLRFVVLEAAPELGHTWRSRWDSLKLFTPAQYDALPGMAFPAPADTYSTKDPVADYLQAYAKAFDLPVQLNAKVNELRRLDDGSFEVRTADATYRARRVVVATGPFQVPFVPPPAAKLDASVAQVHSANYRNPQTLPEGPVLVVGGGNSGFQIAEELAATRTVDLSIATTYPMLPQRRAGRDLFWWLTRLGLMRVTVDSRLGRRASRREFIIGTNRKRLERAGVRFRPRLVDADVTQQPSTWPRLPRNHLAPERADDGNPGTQDGRVRALPRNHAPRHGRTVAGLLGPAGLQRPVPAGGGGRADRAHAHRHAPHGHRGQDLRRGTRPGRGDRPRWGRPDHQGHGGSGDP
jgi:cation diffusion facilitator CzcD-associated flavoprotein CzcO